MDEVWKDVPDWPGYQVSDHGQVRSCRRRKIGGLGETWHPISSTPGSTGRRKVILHVDKKKRTVDVHRLMMEVFIGPCPEGHEACHRDDDFLRNTLDNLYWGTPKQNSADAKRNGKQPDKRGEKHHMAKLNNAQVLAIRRRTDSGENHTAVAGAFGVTRKCVADIHHRKRWSHIPEETIS